MPQTFLTPIIIFVAVIFCFGVLFVGDFNLFFVGTLIPPILVSCTRIDLWMMAILITHLSSLRVPGMPGQMVLCQVLIAGMVGLSILRALTAHLTPRFTWCKFWCFFFLVVIAMLMRERGSGFRALDSEMWGGSVYVNLITSALFFLFADQVPLKPRAWRLVFLGMFTLAILPAVSELILALSGGNFRWHLLFLLPRTTAGSMTGAIDSEITRFHSLVVFIPAFLLPFLLVPFSGKYRKWYTITILSVFFIGGLSGHRMVLVMIFLTIWIHMFFCVRNKISFILASALFASGALLLLGQMAPLLPKPHQRMLSVIPFANIARDVSLDATSTVTWRLQLWHEAIKMIPEYLWLGKGFAFAVDAYMSQAAQYSEAFAIRWAVVQTAFHQGILSLLVGMGIPGLISGLGFLVGICLRHYRFQHQPWRNSSLQRMHMAIFSYFVSQSVIYVFIYGDVQRSFPSIFMYAAILECLTVSDSQLPDAAPELDRDPPAFAHTRALLRSPPRGGPYEN